MANSLKPNKALASHIQLTPLRDSKQFLYQTNLQNRKNTPLTSLSPSLSLFPRTSQRWLTLSHRLVNSSAWVWGRLPGARIVSTVASLAANSCWIFCGREVLKKKKRNETQFFSKSFKQQSRGIIHRAGSFILCLRLQKSLAWQKPTDPEDFVLNQ